MYISAVIQSLTQGHEIMNKTSKLIDMRALPIVLAFLMSGHVLAGTYKWVDEEGNVQYTQTPPPAGIAAETIKPPPRVDTEKALKDLQAQEEKADKLRQNRLDTAKKEEEAKQEQDLQKKNCEMARARLASYDQPMVKFVQEDGSKVRATEEERQAEIAKSQDMIKEWCK